MSSCLVLQTREKLYIGADTSSSIFVNNKLYRLNNSTKKLFQLNNNSILYCAGNNLIASKVKDYIIPFYNNKYFSFYKLQDWLLKNFALVKGKQTIYDVEILIATIENNETIVYQLSQYNNYELTIHKPPKNGVQILSAGIKNQDCMSYAEKELLSKNGVKAIYTNTFNALSCNYIGGNLDLYEISIDSLNKIYNNEKIYENGIQYIANVFKKKSVSINAEVLLSKLVMSENLWIENSSGTYKFDENGFIASNGTNTIKIQPNKSDELFSIYKGSSQKFYIDSSGNVNFSGNLSGATGTFTGLLSGGSINIGNGNFTVDSNGNMYATTGTYSGSININNAFTVTSNGYMTATSGLIGNWYISSGALIGSASNYRTVLTPAQIEFQETNRSLRINPTNIGWEYSDGTFCSLIKPLSIFTPEYKGYKFTLSGGSQFTIDARVGTSYSSGGVAIYGYTTFYAPLRFTGDARTYGTSSGTTDKYLYITGNGGNESIPSAGWVKGFTNFLIDDIKSWSKLTFATLSHTHSNYALSSHTHSNYASSSHTHSNYASSASANTYSGSPNAVVSNMRISGNTLIFAKYSNWSSDKRLKVNITDLPDLTEVYMNIQPKKFKFNSKLNGYDSNWHYGVIAQDIEKAFKKVGITLEDTSLVYKTECDKDFYEKEVIQDDYVYKVDKNELHALHIQMIQNQQRKIEQLEKDKIEIEKRLSILENILKNNKG